MAAYGSGHFGRWITDEAGLPAYEYTCNHLQDPAAEYATQRGASRDHFHLLGNYHASALAHNEGYVEFFRPDTVGAWLNRYAPERRAYAGGFGFLRVDRRVRSTLYQHLGGPHYRRVWGVGYFRKRATWGSLAVEQVTLSPFGNDPVLLNLTTLINRGMRPMHLSYYEYWDVLVTPVHSGQGELGRIVEGLRVRRSTRYDAKRRLLVCSPIGPFPGAGAPPGGRDPDPPTVFLAAIDGQAVAAYETSRAQFFGEGGLDSPSALNLPFLVGTTFPRGTHAGDIVLAMQRNVSVPPRSRLTLAHLYGYGAWDSGRFDATGSRAPAGLVERYAARGDRWLQESLKSWRESLVRFEAPDRPWLTREVAWDSYYAQALASVDAYTDEVFLDQGGCQTYDWGVHGSPRDSCRHALALLPNNPGEVRSTIRYLARMSKPDGSLAEAHLGHGRRAPTRRPPSDLQLWLLWLIADYVLYYRDRTFADMEVPLYPQEAGRTTTIRRQVRRSLDYLRHAAGRGSHGLLRLLASDGNDALASCRGFWARRQLVREGESTLTSGLAGVVLPRVAELCRWLGEKTWAQEVEEWAADNRRALLEAWNGRWFDRVLLPDGDEPVGRGQLFLDAQPWIVLAGAADAARRAVLFHEIKSRLVDPSPIGPAGLDPLGLDGQLPPGHAMNGGVSFAAGAALAWAWALEDPAAAWALLGKCTLATHAERYPEQWAGIWSAPDGFCSHAADHPGMPWQYRRPLYEGAGRRSQRDLPIASGHSASHLLFALAHLAGLEADSRGLRLQPRLPCDHFTFEAARMGVRWAPGRVAGYLVPQGNDAIQFCVRYPDPLPGQPRLQLDGHSAPVQLSSDGHEVSFRAFVRGGMRTEWEITTE